MTDWMILPSHCQVDNSNGSVWRGCSHCNQKLSCSMNRPRDLIQSRQVKWNLPYRNSRRNIRSSLCLIPCNRLDALQITQRFFCRVSWSSMVKGNHSLLRPNKNGLKITSRGDLGKYLTLRSGTDTGTT